KFRQSVQQRFGNLFEDVELAELMSDIRPQLLEHLGIRWRAVRGDAPHALLAFVELLLELLQKSADVIGSRVVVENAKNQTIVAAVVYDRKDTEGPGVDFVNGQIAAELGQRFVQV